jgi:hypothetical protein
MTSRRPGTQPSRRFRPFPHTHRRAARDRAVRPNLDPKL